MAILPETRKRQRKAALLVVGSLVCVFVLVAAVGAWLEGFIGSNDACIRSFVRFGGVEREPDRAIVDIAMTQGRDPLSMWGATLAANDTTVAELRPLADGARDGSLAFEDADGDGRTSAGDRFVVSPLPEGRYELRLAYADCGANAQTWTVG